MGYERTWWVWDSYTFFLNIVKTWRLWSSLFWWCWLSATVSKPLKSLNRTIFISACEIQRLIRNQFNLKLYIFCLHYLFLFHFDFIFLYIYIASLLMSIFTVLFNTANLIVILSQPILSYLNLSYLILSYLILSWFCSENWEAMKMLCPSAHICFFLLQVKPWGVAVEVRLAVQAALRPALVQTKSVPTSGLTTLVSMSLSISTAILQL